MNHKKIIIFGEKKLGLAVISECEIFMIKVPGKTHQAAFLSFLVTFCFSSSSPLFSGMVFCKVRTLSCLLMGWLMAGVIENKIFGDFISAEQVGFVVARILHLCYSEISAKNKKEQWIDILGGAKLIYIFSVHAICAHNSNFTFLFLPLWHLLQFLRHSLKNPEKKTKKEER